MEMKTRTIPVCGLTTTIIIEIDKVRRQVNGTLSRTTIGDPKDIIALLARVEDMNDLSQVGVNKKEQAPRQLKK